MLVSLIAATLAAFYNNFRPSTDVLASSVDVPRFIEQTFLLSIICFIAGEMLRIKYTMSVIEEKNEISIESSDQFRIQIDTYNSFNNKLVKMLGHEDRIVREIVPSSMKEFFDSIEVNRDFIDLESDYFGAEVYVKFLGAVKDIQVANPASKVILRASHSASLNAWKGRDQLNSIQSEFKRAKGELYRIIIRNTNSTDQYEDYDRVIQTMGEAGANVFFFDNTDLAQIRTDDCLLSHIGDSFYTMRWKWDPRQGGVGFGAISGCELFLDMQNYKDHAYKWDSLVRALMDNNNPSTPSNMPRLNRKPTPEELKQMIVNRE